MTCAPEVKMVVMYFSNEMSDEPRRPSDEQREELDKSGERGGLDARVDEDRPHRPGVYVTM